MHGETETVVVNTGPLIALGGCGQVGLLRALHNRILVPDAVAAELDRLGPACSGIAGVTCRRPEWIEVVALAKPPSAFLSAYLDVGEASVIELAHQMGVSLVIVDERRGR